MNYGIYLFNAYGNVTCYKVASVFIFVGNGIAIAIPISQRVRRGAPRPTTTPPFIKKKIKNQSLSPSKKSKKIIKKIT
jgi:hypothetical protein